VLTTILITKVNTLMRILCYSVINETLIPTTSKAKLAKSAVTISLIGLHCRLHKLTEAS